MKLFVVIFFVEIVSVLRAETVSDTDVLVCYSHLVDKLRALNGGFLTQEQGIDLMNRVSDQYLGGTPIQQIADNMRSTTQEIMEPDQAAIFADVYNNTVEILGSRETAEELYQQAINLTMNFISSDQKTIDDQIASLRAQDASDEEIKRSTCQTLYGMITPEKKKDLVQKIGDLIPEDEQQAVKDQFSRIIDLSDV